MTKKTTAKVIQLHQKPVDLGSAQRNFEKAYEAYEKAKRMVESANEKATSTRKELDAAESLLKQSAQAILSR